MSDVNADLHGNDTTGPPERSLAADGLRLLHIVIVAGVGCGLVVLGIGSRLAMLLLRVTSSDSVRGLRSDDGFTIGRFTLADTYGLVQIGAVVGPIGAATYLLLRRWLVGPTWFRYTTVALASGAVGGSMLLHAEGVDFRVLAPRWLTLSLFIAIPFLFGGTVAIAVDVLERPRAANGPTWRSHLIALLLGPGALLSYVYAVPVTLIHTALGAGAHSSAPSSPTRGLIVRAFWLGIASLGLKALVADIQAILDLPPPP
jgi:hypothetical protein